MNTADRWLIDGDCRLCRRQKYCTKRCRLNKKFSEALALKVIGEHVSDGFKAAIDALSEVADHHKETDEEKAAHEQKLFKILNQEE